MNRFFPAFAGRSRPGVEELVGRAVGADGNLLRVLLARTAPVDLSVEQIWAGVEDNLWMLGPETFRYFLPAFMELAVEHYDRLVAFTAQLVDALTEPSREDVLRALDRAEQVPAAMRLAPATLRQLREQQLEWFDSGVPLATYEERVDGLSELESDAVLDFLATMRAEHGDDFPFDEPQVAIDRHRARRERR